MHTDCTMQMKLNFHDVLQNTTGTFLVYQSTIQMRGIYELLSTLDEVVDGAGGNTREDTVDGEGLEPVGQGSRGDVAFLGDEDSSETSDMRSGHGGTRDAVGGLQK